MESDKQELSGFEKFEAVLNSSSGEDEKMLELAAKYSVQLSAQQIRILLAINMIADFHEMRGYEVNLGYAKVLRSFLKNYIMYKQYHASDFFVTRAIENLSLRRFINSDAFKVNVQKQ